MRLFEADRIKTAAKRFTERASAPLAGLEAPRQAGAPASERRKQWLAQNLTQDRVRATVFEAESHGARRSPQDTLRMLAQERIIGSRDIVDINYLEVAIAIGRAVCRVRIGSGAGTGFLVGPRIMITNNHVIESRADALQAMAQFDYQDNVSGELLPVHAFPLDPDLFFMTNPILDFTLVGVGATSLQGRPIEDYPWVRLMGQLGKAEKGEPVNIIQHPRGSLKQIALRNNEIIEIPEGKRDFLYYTTDTEPGSSGSPCFNDQWELVALHHSGVPRMQEGQILKRDGTAWRDSVDDPGLIDWIANEGARVSAIVDALNAANLSSQEQEVRSRMLNERGPNPVELVRKRNPHETASVQVARASSGGTSISLTVPLTLTVSLGPPAYSGAVEAPQPQTIPADGQTGADVPTLTEAVVIDPNWSNRQGYDPRFLGVDIPLPKLSADARAKTVEVPSEYRKNGDRFVLHYHHYSLAMHKKRRFAWFSAANIDGDRRYKLPKRDDKWFIDPRIDDPKNPRFQCGEELYATAKTDRGHLTRYLDVAWGESKAEAVRSTNDTFHFTNCCLQLSGFNQGIERWQGLEQNLLEKKAKREMRRMVVFTGPVFKRHDPIYRNPFMNYSIRIPVEFWKVCALIRQDGSLAATGFKLSQQDITELPGFEEAFDVTAAQVTLKELEELTGLGFGMLTAHDHFAAGGDPGTLEIEEPGGKRKIKPLRSPEDIVI
jgi:endonuclease G